MSTIKDVAAFAGVSIATVSNYLNGTKPVSKKASAKIQEAVEKLQYSQNLSAKSLKSNTYNDIGIILPTFDDPYYVQIFQGIELAFQNSSYFLNLAFSYDVPELEQNIVRQFLKKNVSGLILISCQPDNWRFYYDNFTSQNKPLVLIDRAIKNLDANFISFDNRAAMEYMTRHFLDQGYQKPCLFTGPSSFTSEEQCALGFQKALKERGIELSSSAIQQTNLNREDAFRQTVRLLRSEQPDIILASSESSATGIMEGLRILGYASEQLPVATLGEEHWNKHTHSFAALSSVRPAMQMGERAARLLFQKIKSPKTEENEKILLNDRILEGGFAFPKPLAQDFSEPESCPGEIQVLMLDTPQVHALTALLKNFELNTGIRTKITILSHPYVLDEIMRTHFSDDSPVHYDVYMFDIPWLYSLASLGVLADISQEIPLLHPELFLPGCLDYYSVYKGHYYGVPFMYAPQIFYYRKDLFDDPKLQRQYEKTFSSSLRPPRTWKEFNVMAEFFTKHTDDIPYGFSMPAAFDECLAPEIYMRLNAYGSKVFNSKNQIVFDNPQTLKAYINLSAAFHHSKPDYEKATDSTAVEDFLKGETAMLISYPSFLMDVVDLRTSSMIGSIGYHQIPGKTPVLGGWSLGVSSNSPNKQEAFQFIKWACTGELSNYFALLGGQSAVTSAYTNDELVKLYPWLPLYYSAYQNTKPIVPPCLKNGSVIPQSRVDQILCEGVRHMVSEALEVDEVLQRTHKNLEELFLSYETKERR